MAKKAYGSKVSMNSYILDILKKHSDENHKLTQQDIMEFLQDEEGPYRITAERKSVKHHLKQLVEEGVYGICYEIKHRSNGAHIWTNFYIDDDERDFTDGELQLLIDSVVFSNHIPERYRKDLILKLSDLRRISSKKSVGSIFVANQITSQNQEIFKNLEDLDEAIREQQKVRFSYYSYKENKKLHPEREVIVNPYRIVAKNSHYYLICQEEPFDNLTHYRIDRIKGLDILEENFPHIPSINMEEYLAQHPYMSAGASEQIRLRIEKDMIGNVIDWFGDKFTIDRSDDKKPDHLLDIRLKANPDDLYYWALQYGNYVEVKAPQELRDRIRDTVQTMEKHYLYTAEDKHNQFIHRLEKLGWLDLCRMQSYAIPSAWLSEKPLAVYWLKLDLNRFDDYSFVKNYTNLESLSLESSRTANKSIDLSILKDLPNLSELRFVNTGLNDLSMIQKLPLKRLSLLEKDIKNLELLYEMPHLTHIMLDSALAEKIDIPHLKEVNPKIKISQYRSHRFE